MEEFKISSTDYMMMQPSYPTQYESDKFYFGLAQELIRIAKNSAIASRCGAEITKQIVLAVVGYYQDIVADAGLWRSMCSIHQHLYGKWLPIFATDEDYVESELNMTDVRLLIWYIIECNSAERGLISPFDDDIFELAKALYKPLEEYYDFAPVSEGFNFIHELELHNPEHAEQVYDFSYWMFWHSYLLRPAAVRAMRDSLEEGHAIVEMYPDPDDAREPLLELNHRIMREYPTGPLALYIKDWLYAIVDNRMPKKEKTGDNKAEEGSKQVADAAHRFITEIEKYALNDVRYMFENKLLPEARFAWEKPGDNILLDNWDFFARLYGQRHYNPTNK